MSYVWRTFTYVHLSQPSHSATSHSPTYVTSLSGRHLRGGVTAPGGGGGGEYFHMYAYWVCAARETPVFSPDFPFRSISFSQIPKKKCVPEHHHFKYFGGFCRSRNHPIIFKISLISIRSSPPTAGSARTQSVRQRRGLARRVLTVPESETGIFTLKTDQARSGAPHFQAQNGSSSFRSPAFPRSTGSSFRSPCPYFTLPRHIPTKIWGEYPPPPSPGDRALISLMLLAPPRGKSYRRFSMKHACSKTRYRRSDISLGYLPHFVVRPIRSLWNMNRNEI